MQPTDITNWLPVIVQVVVVVIVVRYLDNFGRKPQAEI
jgi:hypothetical protein